MGRSSTTSSRRSLPRPPAWRGTTRSPRSPPGRSRRPSASSSPGSWPSTPSLRHQGRHQVHLLRLSTRGRNTPRHPHYLPSSHTHAHTRKKKTIRRKNGEIISPPNSRKKKKKKKKKREKNPPPKPQKKKKKKKKKKK